MVGYDADIVQRARAIAFEALRDDLRSNGRPFIEHADGVARIAADEIGLGVECLAAVYLHEATRFHREVLWASGACLMVRASLWHELGGLDDRFFAHMEEIDLCWRIQLAGYRVTSVPASHVYHIGGGTLPNESPFKLRLNYRNNLLLLENNLAKTFRTQGYRVEGALGKARRRILVRMLLDGASAASYLINKKWGSYKAVVRAHAEYWKLRRKATPDEVASQQKEATIHGWYPKWMVPRALAGRKIKFI